MFEHIHHVHLIGANGVGVSAVGKLFLHWGRKVSGSDLHRGIFFDELEKLGASLNLSHERSHLPKDADLVVYSSAVPESNPERRAAVLRGIKTMSFAEFLGELAKGYTTIAVTGTHGKSTTTAMIGKVLEAAGMDPTVIVGSRVPGWPLGNVRVPSLQLPRPNGRTYSVGRATPNLQLLIIEACEHMAHHLKIQPDIGVITNIEFDHPDFYRDVEHVAEVMEEWAREIPVMVLNADDPFSTMIPLRTKLPDRSFSSADVSDLRLKVPGAYNKANAAAALAVARALGVGEAVAQRALEAFPGIWRRFEHVGIWHATSFANDVAGADVYSDYGHHPTAIRETIKTARDLFPGRRLVHIFQPHQHARTAELFDAFVSVLGEADVTILVEIYGVAGRTRLRPLTSFRATDGQVESETVSTKDLVTEVKRARPAHRSSESEGGLGSFVRYAESLDAAERLVREIAKPGDVLFFQGAGDIDDVARRLVS